MATTDPAIEAVTRFMDANYRCKCGDTDCPGNSYEAAEIVRMVRDHDSR